MIDSLILRTSGRLILPAALVFSVYVLLRGHNAPGGGFIGGLIAAGGFTVYALPRGRTTLLALLRVRPKALVGAGLLFALVSGLPGLVLGQPFLTHQWSAPGGVPVGSTLIFDLGVYLVVVGAALAFLSFYLED